MQTDQLDAYTEDAVIKDGRTVRIRPIEADDLDAMMDMWSQLSQETIRLRFFAPRRMDREQMRHFTEVDYENRFALVALRGTRILGVARFDRYDDDPETAEFATAEFAALVIDAEQGHGIGTALVRALLRPARDLGITNFRGDILRENRRMQNVLRDAGLEPAFASVDGAVETNFRVVPSERFLEAFDEQDREAAVAALSTVFSPASVAVIGASRDPDAIGGRLFDNLRRGRFSGAVYPVHASADVVQTVAAYPTVADCPTVPDMVIVCVPAEQVVDVVTEAAEAGTRAAVIVSAGFAEIGDEGAQREQELLDVARSYGVRVVGPNSMGVLNAVGDVRMNATFSDSFPVAGNVAFSSQSGALGLAILSGAQRLGMGLSSFASIGNKIDISGNDLLQYWESDDATAVILLYLESFGNPRKFGRIARRIGRRKPIVAVKSGRTGAGERAASSHTGALAAGDTAVDALFAQAGVIRTGTLAELFGVASVLSTQPLPEGGRVGIVTNGGGPGTLAADACDAAGLEVVAPSADTVERLRALLPPEAGTGNPIDVTAATPADAYGDVMRVLAEDAAVDMLLVICTPPMTATPAAVAAQIVEANDDVAAAIPVVAVFMAVPATDSGRSPVGDAPATLTAAGVPTFDFPEEAADALSKVARYAAWRRQPLGDVVEITDTDGDAARAVVDGALDGADDVWLDSTATGRLLAAFGIPTARTMPVRTGTQAADAQRDIDGPVAIKLAAPVHESEVDGVRLHVTSPDAAAEAIEELERSLHAEGRGKLLDDGFVVQEMVADGVEVVVGVSHDATFGPVLMVGMGGALVELLGDTSARIHPLTDRDVDDMLSDLRGYPLLTGYRGADPVDVDALRTVLFRVSALIEAVPEIAELDLNPVFVRRSGVSAVDARVRLNRRS